MTTFAEAWARARASAVPAGILLTISHESFGTIRLVGDTVDLVSRGETFSAAPIKFDLPQDDDQVPRATLQLPNVDPEMGRTLMRVVDPPQLTLEVVLLSNPDEPVRRYARMELRNVKIDPINITGEIWGTDNSSEPLGTMPVNPTNNPALFARRG